jgi:hypothetical protein
MSPATVAISAPSLALCRSLLIVMAISNTLTAPIRCKLWYCDARKLSPADHGPLVAMQQIAHWLKRQQINRIWSSARATPSPGEMCLRPSYLLVSAPFRLPFLPDRWLLQNRPCR